MTAQVVQVHFSVSISQTLGPDVLPGWADYIRSWIKDENAPDMFFGRDAPNSLNGSPTYARHLHVVPEDAAREAAWLKKHRAYDRTSDDLVIYSFDRANPVRYGIYLLDFLADPNGHKVAFNQRAAGQQQRELWENIAWNHQIGIFSPAFSA